MASKKSYWGYAFLTIVVASMALWGFQSILPDKIFPEFSAAAKDHIVVDEMMQKALDEKQTDALVEQERPVEDSLNQKEAEGLQEPDPEIPNKLLADDLSTAKENYYLDHFYQQLALLEEAPEQHKVRIAYFGDSMTDGDLIVQDVRQFFQEKYGGKGVGFVPITSESATSRISVIHRFSPNWKMDTYMKTYRDQPTPPFGVSGQVFYAVDSLAPHWVQYASGQNAKNRLLPQPTLYYGLSSNDSAVVKAVLNKDTVSFPLTPNKILNTLPLSTADLNTVRLRFEQADSIPLYGVDMNASYGVQVDNFSNRGNSGLPLSQLNTPLMRAFGQEDIHYDLIVLQYGTNVMSSERLEYGWYARSMGRVVQHLRQAFPGTSILVVSIADRSHKYGNEMKTDSAVVPLLQAQKAYATEAQTGFVNLYELMGGRNSMVEWVEKDPPKANKDYTHFNPWGAKAVAKMIFNEIEEGFHAYKKQVEQHELEVQREAERRRDSLRARRDSLPIDSVVPPKNPSSKTEKEPAKDTLQNALR